MVMATTQRSWVCEVTIPMKKELLGVHAFTGNDYVPASFKKMKENLLVHKQDYPQLVDVYLKLGNDWELMIL